MIKTLRLSRGWSQEDLAEFSGLSIRTIQRLERGQRGSAASLKCVAAALEVEFSELQPQGAENSDQFLGANPVLPVTSVADTAVFYQEVLGFEVELLWQSPPYLVVARDQTIIEFGEGRKHYAGTGVCLIFVNDVDALYQELLAKPVEMVGDIADRDYGNRDFRIRDNSGNMLIFSSPLINQSELLAVGQASN